MSEFTDKVRRFEVRSKLQNIDFHKNPNYALYDLGNAYLVFDGGRQYRLPKEKAYQIGKRSYIKNNHPDSTPIIDFGGWSSEEVDAAMGYEGVWNELAVRMALQKRGAKVGLSDSDFENPKLLLEKIKSDDWSRRMYELKKREFANPFPKSIEQRHQYEREYDQLVMEAFEEK